jgi:hypothetical protein
LLLGHFVSVTFYYSYIQGPIYWKIPPWGGIIWGKNRKRQREKGGKYKKRKKGERKRKKGERKSKRGERK